MKQTTKETLKNIFWAIIAAAFIFGAFCWAGTMDYNHAVEMGYITETTK